ncbi:DUF6882 domain-containing protein [Nocardiopsis halotolerans]|uniref:DUF6882 domain-containing protein n=1 Tax=Nocardiopsis halotolerans TaxID=124252 RepID=UPI000344A304|nr:DUF6882 domain-containing protein [Nocardiopsis halotolerans]
MTGFFSTPLLRLAQPHLAWVVEQMTFFDEAVPFGDLRVELDQESVWRGDRRLRVGLLGSYAEDGTWLWGWANPAFEGEAVVADTLRLRELGRSHAAPELSEGLVDLNHFPDPRLASDHMSLIAMGLLGTRGNIIFNHAGRARTFLTVTDPEVPWALPRAATAERFLRMGSMLMPGPESEEGRGYADAVVGGYAEHHGLPVERAHGRTTLELPSGNRITVALGHADTLEAVDVTGPDGVEPVPEAAQVVPAPSSDGPGPGPRPRLPRSVLTHVLPRIAAVLRREAALEEYVKGLGWSSRERPEWDPAAGVLRYPGCADLEAREIGRFAPGTGLWEWAASEGASTLRSAAREGGSPELDADGVDLSAHHLPGLVAQILSRTAADLDGALSYAEVESPDGRWTHLAVTDTRLEVTGTDPQVAAHDLESAANLTHPVVPEEDRREAMRALVLGYFERYGVRPMDVFGPAELGGMIGLYVIRVQFAGDGSLHRVDWGLMHEMMF